MLHGDEAFTLLVGQSPSSGTLQRGAIEIDLLAVPPSRNARAGVRKRSGLVVAAAVAATIFVGGQAQRRYDF